LERKLRKHLRRKIDLLKRLWNVIMDKTSEPKLVQVVDIYVKENKDEIQQSNNQFTSLDESTKITCESDVD
jgi:hypothetical protein